MNKIQDMSIHSLLPRPGSALEQATIRSHLVQCTMLTGVRFSYSHCSQRKPAEVPLWLRALQCLPADLRINSKIFNMTPHTHPNLNPNYLSHVPSWVSHHLPLQTRKPYFHAWQALPRLRIPLSSVPSAWKALPSALQLTTWHPNFVSEAPELLFQAIPTLPAILSPAPTPSNVICEWPPHFLHSTYHNFHLYTDWYI